MKHRIYRLLTTFVRLCYFVAACMVVVPQWRKWHNDNGKITGNVKEVLTAILCTLIQPRRGAAFRGLSLPVSSRCHSFPGTTWDAGLFVNWYKGRENPLGGLPLIHRLIFFFANLAIRSGYISIAWQMYMSMKCSNVRMVKVFGMLGQLDVAILFRIWGEQLATFYQADIWFNPDSVDGYHDDLSDLFKCIRPETVDELYQKIISLAPHLAVAHEMYGEYCESLLCFDQALTAYQAGMESNPDSLLLKKRSGVLAKFKGSALFDEGVSPFITPVMAWVTSAADVCKEFDWPYERKGNDEAVAYAFDLVLNGHLHRRDVQLTVPAHALAHCKNSIRLKGGLVLSHYGGNYYVLLDSKHLDIRHLKLFVPGLVAHDRRRALIQRPHIPVEEVCEKAFVITGAGWNYYHWLYETIPYIELYESGGYWKDMPLSFQFPLRSWHKETLELLGCKHFDILPYKGKPTIYKECVIPTHSSRDLVPSPSAIRFLREKLAKPGIVKNGKRVFLSRSGVHAVRGMRNRDDINIWMDEHGFVLLDTSIMSISEQIEFFSDVEIVAAEGGAALSNLVFCPAETKVLVMAASRAWAETFSAIAGELGQHMVAVLGESHPSPNPYYLWTAFDYAIATKDLDLAINSLTQY